MANRLRIPLSELMALALWLVAGVTLACALVAAWPFSTDDAYITLRYSRNLADGAGIVFNAGSAPVEGYSNFLFVLVGAIAIKLQLDPMLVLKLVGVASLVGTLWCVNGLGRRHLPGCLSTAPALILCLYVGTAWWAVSGMETMLAQFLLTAALLALDSALTTNRATLRGHIAIVFPLALLVVTRPEGSVFAAIVVLMAATAWVFVKDRGLSGHGLVASASVLALVGLVYHGWRVWYFGHLLPNTVACKANFAGDPLSLHKELWGVFAPVLLLAAVGALRARVRLALLAVPLFVQGVLLVGIDPIIGYHSRHFLVALPGVSILAVLGSSELGNFLLRVPSLASVGALVAVTVLSPRVNVARLHLEAEGYARRMEMREHMASWIDSTVPEGGHVVLGDCGMTPYKSSRLFIDALCLNSREMTDLGRNAEKFADFALSSRPEALIVSNNSWLKFRPAEGLGVWPAIVRDSRFGEYELKEKFVGGGACYWAYTRRTPASKPKV
jgi:hypothetical protein